MVNKLNPMWTHPCFNPQHLLFLESYRRHHKIKCPPHIYLYLLFHFILFIAFMFYFMFSFLVFGYLSLNDDHLMHVTKLIASHYLTWRSPLPWWENPSSIWNSFPWNTYTVIFMPWGPCIYYFGEGAFHVKHCYCQTIKKTNTCPIKLNFNHGFFFKIPFHLRNHEFLCTRVGS